LRTLAPNSGLRKTLSYPACSTWRPVTISRAVKYEPRSSTLLTFVLAFPVDNYNNISDFSAAVFTRARWPSYRPDFTLACRAYQGDVKLGCASGRRSIPPLFQVGLCRD
jgi:hypothetical protein